MAQRLWLLRSAANKLSVTPALRRRPPHTVTSSNHHPLLLSSLGVPRRSFSEAAAAATTSNSNESTAVSPPPKLPQKMKKIPTRHSIHQPPAIPQTVEFLTHVTEELTGAAPGSLFLASSTTDDTTTTDPQVVKWWDAHYDLLEQTSFALRGHASYIPGSLYYKQSSKTSNAAPEQQHHLMQMQAILTKLMDDGELYMQVRHQKRLQQQKQQKEELQPQQSASEFGAQSNVQEQELSGNSSSEEESSSSSSSDEEDEDGEHLSYEECPPGPSIVHYDIYLDALSAALPNMHDDDDNLDNTIIISPNDIVDILESVLERHELDGGDLHNVNPHTIPTQQTLNAALRAIANIPYNSDSSNDERLRDEALQAFGIFNHLEHSPLLECNAASFCYMLQIVNKYIPTSRTKGNISMALWMQATKKGVVDASVVQAFQQCHSPSNGPEFEHVVQERTTSVSELPTRWIKRAKAKRFVKTSTRY